MPKILENPRQRILDSAREILLKNGYQEFNIRDVARSCQVSVGTIYNYFPNKHDLVSEVVIQFAERALSKIDDISQESGDIYDKLRKVYLEIHNLSEMFREIWLRMSVGAKWVYPDKTIETHNMHIDQLTKALERILENAVVQTSVQSPLPPKEMSAFIIQSFMVMTQLHGIEYDSMDAVFRKLFS